MQDKLGRLHKEHVELRTAAASSQAELRAAHDRAQADANALQKKAWVYPHANHMGPLWVTVARRARP